MLRILTERLFLLFSWTLFIGVVHSYAEGAEKVPESSKALSKDKPKLVKPMKSLFSHKNHLESFKKLDVSCTTCHSFSVKTQASDPLAEGVEAGLIKPDRKTCHQCHMEAISLPRPNQCTLCHADLKELMPKDHSQNWKVRHGRFAQIDQDACKKCHANKTCSECHTQRDALKPAVHRPNFRVTHSIEARAHPQSCVTCHSTNNSCTQCHTKGLR